jgi:hypothetical protein
MNIANRNRNLAIPPIGPAKKTTSQIAFCVLGLLLTPFAAHAASVTLSLGQTAQNFTLAGLGSNGSGLGTYTVTMGACAPVGPNTQCTLSGAFTGTASGLTSGTYSLVTTYPGNGPTPLRGVEQAPSSDLFAFSSIPAGTTMTLTLVSSSGTVVVPIFSAGHFAAGATFGFVYSSLSDMCSGTPVSSCSVGQVGVTAGAVITGPVTGTATFNQGNNYYISQLAFAGRWQMTLTYVNYSPQTVTCVTNFYSDAGSPLPVPFGSGTVSSRTDVLQPGQSIHDQSVADLNAPVSQGWAQAACDGPIQASLLYRLYTAGVPVGEAGVNAETAPTTEFATFAQTATGVAYANPSATQSAAITIKVFNAAGAPLGSTVITLGPLAHGAANLGPLLGLQSFTGFVKVTSTIPIISLSLNFEAFPVFSSLPPGDLPSSTTLVN